MEVHGGFCAGERRGRLIWRRIDADRAYLWLLLLFGVGVCERARTAQALGIYGKAARSLAVVLSQLRQVAAQDPAATIEQVNGMQRLSVTVAIAVAHIEQALSVAQRSAMPLRLRGPFADIAVAWA